MNVFKNYFSGVPEYNHIKENLKKDCIGNMCSGLQTAFVANFIAIVAKKYLGASGLQLSILVAATFINGLISIFVSGACPVNKEKKCIALLGSMVCVLGMCSLPFVTNAWTYVIFYVLTCVIGAYGPLYNVVIERIYPENIRAFLLGKSKFFIAVSAIVGSLVAGYLIELKIFSFDTWRIVFFIGYFIYLGNFLLCFNRLKISESNSDKPNSFRFLKDSFSLLKTDIRNTWFIVSGFFFTGGIVIANTIVPIYQNDIMKIGPKEVGILLFIQNIFWMAGYPIYGKFLMKNGVIKGWILTCVLASMLPLGYIISFNNWFVLFAFYAFTGLFTTGNDMAWLSIILKTANPEKLTQYQSLHCFFLAIRGIVALGVSALVVGIGEKAHIDYRILFGISILFIVISVIIFINIFKNYKE